MPPLARDASALYDAMTELIRLYQFRDRDRLGYHGLTITQCYVLQILIRRGPITLNTLADEMHLDKSVVSRVVDGLEATDAVKRTANPADGRSTFIAATRAGKGRYLKVEADVVGEYEHVLSGFPAAVRRQLVALIGQLTVAMRERKLEELAEGE